MHQYMLIMSGSAKAFKDLGPERCQKLMEKYHAFVGMLKQTHGFNGGSALSHSGFEIRKRGNGLSVDGPFPETKEVLNGYMLFNAPSFEVAVELTKQCPALLHGESVQLFQLFD